MYIAHCKVCLSEVRGLPANCENCGAHSSQFDSIPEAAYKKLLSNENLGAVFLDKCPSCDWSNKRKVKFCSECGEKLYQEQSSNEVQEAYVYCTECGIKNLQSNTACSHCNANIQDQLSIRLEELRKRKRAERFATGATIVAGVIAGIVGSAAKNSNTNSNNDVMNAIRQRVCPFCHAWTMGTGPCNSCAR